MKILQTGKTKQGYNIQVEEWSENYSFMEYGATLAIYKPSKVSLKGQFTPKENQNARFQFNFKDHQEAKKAFNDLLEGKKDIKDFIDNIKDPRLKDCI